MPVTQPSFLLFLYEIQNEFKTVQGHIFLFHYEHNVWLTVYTVFIFKVVLQSFSFSLIQTLDFLQNAFNNVQSALQKQTGFTVHVRKIQSIGIF